MPSTKHLATALADRYVIERDVSPDGNHFAMVRAQGPSGAR
jgi:hypothetical protein